MYEGTWCERPEWWPVRRTCGRCVAFTQDTRVHDTTSLTRACVSTRFAATTGGANLKKLARGVGPDLVSIAFCAAVFYYCAGYEDALAL